MAATLQLDSSHRPRTTAAHGRLDTTAAPGRLGTEVYVRRRIAVGAALVLVGALLWTVATWATNSSVGVDRVGADRSGPAQMHVVQPGETLWTIAATIDTDGDLRDTVDMLAERNGGSALQVGQRLVVGG